jgi:SynChlorMet cassette radical SAM/SPASM protein ScmE
MRYSLLTNGTLINEEVLRQFDIGKRRKRLSSIQVSIDGSTAEIHNLSRPNSFDHAVKGLRLLKNAGFPLTVRVTLNRHNIKDLENIAYFLLEDIGLPSFSTNDAAPIGAGCKSSADISLTPHEQAETMQIISRLMEKYPGRLQATAGPQAKIQMYAEMEHARATGEKSSRWQMGYLSACGCIFSKLSIMHDGAIVPCHILSGIVLGSIITDSMTNIWKNHATLLKLRERRNISMQEVAGCSGCDWAEFCNGSCPGLAHQLTGDFNQANPIDCYNRFLMEIKREYEFNGR